MYEKILSTLERLVEIPSVTNDREAVQKALDFLEQACHASLFRKRVTEAGKESLLISLQDTLDLDVLILTHADVVPALPEMFSLRQDGDKLIGRGAIDMKGSIAAALNVLNELASEGVSKKIGLLVAGDEEIGGNTTWHWIKELGLKAKIVLDSDCGEDINRIIEKSKQVIIAKIVAQGERAHGALPWLGVDAIELLGEANAKLRALFPAYSKHNDPADKWVSTAHIGLMQGGEAVNTVAPSASATWDFRLIGNEDSARVRAALDSLPDGVTYEIATSADAVVADNSNPMFQSYCDLVREKTGKPVLLDFSCGATDARHFAPMKALIIPHQPTGGEFHGDNEWISAKALKDYAEILLDFLRKVA
ncbi:MAG: M20/M25/M40 family metallo-hydrolase [Alphaproteobacteria bacterium]|nr:M20/M25/M40 family metallo-hydrolase [Alphaproteobacteria bacterium]